MYVFAVKYNSDPCDPDSDLKLDVLGGQHSVNVLASNALIAAQAVRTKADPSKGFFLISVNPRIKVDLLGDISGL